MVGSLVYGIENFGVTEERLVELMSKWLKQNGLDVIVYNLKFDKSELIIDYSFDISKEEKVKELADMLIEKLKKQ